MKLHAWLSIIALVALSTLTAASSANAAPACRVERHYLAGLRNLGEAIVIYKVLSSLGGEMDASVLAEASNRYRVSEEKQKNAAAEWVDIARKMNIPVEDTRKEWRADNCLYLSPVNTFRNLVTELGEASPYLKNWVSNQTTVLKACVHNYAGDNSANLELKHIEAGPARAVFDTEYQAASLAFYKGDYDSARKGYEKIYASNSPYNGLAAYMVARTLGQIEAYNWILKVEKEPRLAKFKPLYDDYKFIKAYRGCSDEDASACVDMNINHLNFLRKNIFEPVSLKGNEKSFLDSIEQLDGYLQKHPENKKEWWFSEADEDSPRLKAYLALAKRDVFFDWLQTYYTYNPFDANWVQYRYSNEPSKEDHDAALNHALLKWQESGNEIWLYLAALRIYPEHENFEKVRMAAIKLYNKYQCRETLSGQLVAETLWPHVVRMEAAKTLPQKLVQELAPTVASAYTSKSFRVGDFYPYDSYYHDGIMRSLIQYLLHEGRYEDIKTLGAAFVKETHFNSELYTIFMSLQKTVDDAFKIAQLADKKLYGSTPLFRASLAIVNGLSTEEIIRLSEKDALPQAISTQATRIAFVRSVLLNNKGLFERAAYQVIKTHPFLKMEIAFMLEASEGDPQSKVVTGFLLRHPRFNLYANENNISDADLQGKRGAPKFDAIDYYNHNDNNWWCRLNPDKLKEGLDKNIFWNVFGQYTDNRNVIDTFYAQAHTDEWVANGELIVLAQKVNAPEYLTRMSIAYAEDQKSYIKSLLARLGLSFKPDNNAAEMLHQSIVTTRYGCNRDGGHGAYSQQAFKILHESYPMSVWTKLTPYWFN